MELGGLDCGDSVSFFYVRCRREGADCVGREVTSNNRIKSGYGRNGPLVGVPMAGSSEVRCFPTSSMTLAADEKIEGPSKRIRTTATHRHRS